MKIVGGINGDVRMFGAARSPGEPMACRPRRSPIRAFLILNLRDPGRGRVIFPNDMDVACGINGDSRPIGRARIPGDPLAGGPRRSSICALPAINLALPWRGRVILPNDVDIAGGIDGDFRPDGSAGIPGHPFSRSPVGLGCLSEKEKHKNCRFKADPLHFALLSLLQNIWLKGMQSQRLNAKRRTGSTQPLICIIGHLR